MLRQIELLPNTGGNIINVGHRIKVRMGMGVLNRLPGLACQRADALSSASLAPADIVRPLAVQPDTGRWPKAQ